MKNMETAALKIETTNPPKQKLITMNNYSNEFSILEPQVIRLLREHYWPLDEGRELDVLGPFWGISFFYEDYSHCLSFQTTEGQIPVRANTLIFVPPFSLFESVLKKGEFGFVGYGSVLPLPLGLPQEATLIHLPMGQLLPPLEQVRRKEQLWDLVIENSSLWQNIERFKPESNLALKIKKYLDDNYENSFKLQEMSDILGHPLPYLDRVFKENYSLSPSQYLKKMRVLSASFQMILNPTSVTEVCYQVGFNNSDNFARQFKKIIGTQPFRYIKPF